ncbi:MAG TPA: hypothetical protein VHM24_14135, partial [Gemmatimonadaceae bacterium]|nr:hypothetical protein [Gemmatimonadaceae bacterium]
MHGLTIIGTSTMRNLTATLLICAAALEPAGAQSAGEHIALGDRAYVELDAPSALSHFEKAIAADPRSYEANWKASRSAVDIGSYTSDAVRRASLYMSGEQYARRAIAL